LALVPQMRSPYRKNAGFSLVAMVVEFVRIPCFRGEFWRIPRRPIDWPYRNGFRVCGTSHGSWRRHISRFGASPTNAKYVPKKRRFFIGRHRSGIR